jgi:Flp pilus assembly protein protease CpaA
MTSRLTIVLGTAVAAAVVTIAVLIERRVGNDADGDGHRDGSGDHHSADHR